MGRWDRLVKGVLTVLSLRPLQPPIATRQAISPRHGRACPGHPRSMPGMTKNVDARDKPGHDGELSGLGFQFQP
ncbi:hypothetical protein CWO91_12380 [Bradyrhizobium genosp. SA-3]|nr:hypothetical protein CWO91_12380 [Bradyrhizobium genosp. SA-3]